MNSPRHPSAFWLAAASVAAMATGALADTPKVVLRDGAVPRAFDVATDELVIIQNKAQGKLVGDLKASVTEQLPGAQILSSHAGKVHVKLSSPIDPARAAAGNAPASGVPGGESLPVLYISGVERNDVSRRLVSSELLVRIPDGQTAEAVGALVGATNAEASRVPNFARVRLPNAFRALEAAEQLQKQGYQVEPQLLRQFQKRAMPDDPYFANQWHLNNTGQGNGQVGIDANVLHAWDITKGAGVTIAIIDDSFEPKHEDLAPNSWDLATGFHHDFNDVDDDPSPGPGDAHGVSVGGVAAARGNNTLGVSGSAPEAQLVGLRLISGPSSDFDTATALYWRPDGLTVGTSNNSWGPFDGAGVNGPGLEAKQALQDAATFGRNELGLVTVFAAGNGLLSNDNSNLDGFANSRFVIAVSAITNQGQQSWYSEPGANILVGAPSNGGTRGIFTTDVTGSGGYNPGAGEPGDRSYTNSFGGTSSAAPLTTGGVALMLAANPGLGWRDVQEILASTAVKIQPTDADWVVNGGGFKFNHKWGGGMIDLTAAVVRAKNWDNLAPERSETVSLTGANVPAAIPDNNATGITRQFTFSDSNLRVEHVELRVDIAHAKRSDLEITLTSPSGTTSMMVPKRPRPSLTFTGDDDTDYADWTFSSTHHWGENSEGVWTLVIRDRTSGTVGTLNSASVSVYGTPAPKQRISFTEAKVSVNENAGVRNITVERLGGTSGEATVDYVFSTDSSAANGSDYNAVDGTITFVDGQAKATIPVPIVDDTAVESNESIYVLLKNPTNAALGGVTLSELQIKDNEANTVSISAPDAVAAETSVDEPAETGTIAFTFDAPVLVNTDVFFKLSGTAFKVADYKSIPDKVTIPAGQRSATITIEPVDDIIPEGSETVIVRLEPRPSYVIGAQNEAQVTILDNEKTDISIVASTTSVVENDSRPITFTISRRSAADTALLIPLLASGTAQPAIDYTPAIPQVVEIPANEKSVKVTVSAVNDQIFRTPRVLTVLVGDDPNFTEGFTTFAQVTFREDDPAPDAKAPKVEIKAPVKGTKVTAPATAIPINGAASDNGSVAQVIYRVNRLPWRLATGTTSWSADIIGDVAFGPNLLEVRALDNDGNESPIASQTFDYVQSRQLTVETVGSGSIRGDSGVRSVGFPVTVTATPAPGFVFGGWTDKDGTLLATARTFTFSMPDADLTLKGRFVASPFNGNPPVTGIYSGVVHAATLGTETSGFIQITVLSSGRFSGFLNFAGVRYPLKGEFTGEGRYRGEIQRKFPLTRLALDLSLDVTAATTQRLTGTIASPDFTCTVEAERAAFSASAPVSADIAGRYTLHFPALVSPTGTQPRGQGYGTLTLSKTGVVKWAGVLPDGTRASQSVPLSKGNTWPLFLTPYKAGGVVLGSAVFVNGTGSHMNGTFNWYKAPSATDRYFGAGFSRENAVIRGSRYVAPSRGARVLDSFNTAPQNAGKVFFREGNLVNGTSNVEFDRALTLGTNNAVTITNPGAEQLKLTLSTGTGTFTGSFIHPVSKKKTAINGVVFQATGEAYGLFLGTLPAGAGYQTGQVTITPDVPPAPPTVAP
ncbi:S8 family serine peptidase [Verrucomicrobiota bacterium sgz303538]